MPIRTLVASVALAALLVACGPASPPGSSAALPGTPPPADDPATRPSLLERVDDAAIAQVYADGFMPLTLPQKVMAYHLYKAAIAGRNIYYDQRHRYGLEMREVLEGILTHPAHVDAATLTELTRYTKLFWLNSGPYANLTAQKFVLRSTPAALLAAAKAALADGAQFDLANKDSLEVALARLGPMFFDPAFEPIVTNKNPPPGQDILTASANNLYAGGVSLADLKGFTEQWPLNSKLLRKPDGTIAEHNYGPAALYFREITAVMEHLTAAAEIAPAPTAKALRTLIQWYKTGSAADRTAYDIAWVQDRAAVVDTINGFTEVYLDPRGVKGAWEGAVFYVNRDKTERIRTLAANAQWFEDHMPWAAQYRKQGVVGITANAMDVLVETGEAGPLTFVGVNLPNDSAVREQYGSKSFSLANVSEAYDKSSSTSLRSEFAWSEEEVARAAKWSGLSADLVTDMHEVIGHASGRLSPTLTGTAADALKEMYSALEEARADLVGLYFLADPKLPALGSFAAADQPAIVQAEYEGFTRNALTQLRRIRDGNSIADDHMRNRQMIVRWLMANTKAIETRERAGKTYYVMVDARVFRDGVGRLLAEVQRIKSEGDFAAAKKLFDTHGIYFEPALRDQVVKRAAALNPPTYTGFVMPKLTPVTGPDGAIMDVRITYPKDFTQQMLEYSGKKKP